MVMSNRKLSLGVGVAVGGLGGRVAVGGTSVGVAVGGAAVGVSVGMGVAVSVGGNGVEVSVGVGRGVSVGTGVQVGVAVGEGVGVWVGSDVGVKVGTRVATRATMVGVGSGARQAASPTTRSMVSRRKPAQRSRWCIFFVSGTGCTRLYPKAGSCQLSKTPQSREKFVPLHELSPWRGARHRRGSRAAPREWFQMDGQGLLDRDPSGLDAAAASIDLDAAPG